MWNPPKYTLREYSARGFSRVESKANEAFPVTSEHDHIAARTRNSCTYVMVANFSNDELTIPSGVAEEVSEALVDRINAGDRSNSSPPTPQHRKKNNRALYQKLLQGKLDHLPEVDRKIIEPVLLECAHVFHEEETNNFKGTNVAEHQILVGDAQPIRRPPYRVGYSLRNEMKAQVKEMLDKGVIRESNSPWSAPAILVPKKSLDGKTKFRFCRFSSPKFRD